jgi:Ribosomal RNA adenine dimethylase
MEHHSMHRNASSQPPLSPGSAASLYCLPPLLPSQQTAAYGGNTPRQYRPRKRCALITAARTEQKADVNSPNRVAWSTRNAGRPSKLKAKRSLGQNFLQREEILLSIVKAAGISPGDRVLEIGPGTGALTRHLLRAGASLTAVEKDDSLYAQLTQDFAQVCSLPHYHLLSSLCCFWACCTAAICRYRQCFCRTSIVVNCGWCITTFSARMPRRCCKMCLSGHLQLRWCVPGLQMPGHGIVAELVLGNLKKFSESFA